jgi:hypothetical protein
LSTSTSAPPLDERRSPVVAADADDSYTLASVARNPVHRSKGEVMAKKKPAPKKTPKVIKGADDGRFKSKDDLRKHPDTTYLQTVKKGKPKKKGS